MNEDINKGLAEIDKRLKEAFNTDGQIPAPEPLEASSQAQPIDLYQAQRNAAYTASQKVTAYGSPAQIGRIVNDIVNDFKQAYYNVSINQYNHLKDVDAKDQAEYMRQDYMVKNALPLVESLVETYGVDAILNNKDALSKLDEVMITGNGSGDGFTAGYLKQMHNQQMGGQPSPSDMEVTRALSKIRAMADSDDIRGSVTEAKRIKEKVDKGELSANEIDYQTLLRVASYK